ALAEQPHLQGRQRFGMAAAQVEELGVRRQGEGLGREAEMTHVHVRGARFRWCLRARAPAAQEGISASTGSPVRRRASDPLFTLGSSRSRRNAVPIPAAKLTMAPSSKVMRRLVSSGVSGTAAWSTIVTLTMRDSSRALEKRA